MGFDATGSIAAIGTDSILLYVSSSQSQYWLPFGAVCVSHVTCDCSTFIARCAVDQWTPRRSAIRSADVRMLQVQSKRMKKLAPPDAQTLGSFTMVYGSGA